MCGSPHFMEEPWSCNEGNVTNPNIYTLIDQTPQYPFTHIKEEPVSFDGGNITDPNSYTPTDHTQQDPTTHIKEEPLSCDGENLTEPNSYTPTDHIQHPEEPVSCSGENLTDLNIYTPTDYTQHPSSYIKEEPLSCDGENLSEPNSYTPTDHTQHPTSIKKEPVLSNGGTLYDLNVYTPTDYTQHLTTHIKEETFSHHKENPIDLDGHTPTDHRQQHPTTHIKEEQALDDTTDTNSGTSKDLTQHLFPHVKKKLVSCNGESLTDIHTTVDSTQQNSSTNTKNKTDFNDGGNLTNPDCTVPTDHTQYSSMEGPVLDKGSSLQKHESSSPEEPVDKDVSKKKLDQNYNDITTSSKKYFCTIQQTTNSLEILYNCPECPECFTSNLDLAKHQIIHTGGMPFICSVCGRCFGRKSDLVIHQVSHGGSNYFVCSHCDLSFATQSSLSIHEKTHEQKKPLPCPECGKTFPTKKRLTRHKQIHSDERPFKCLECGDRFKRKAHLQRHQTIHEKAKQLLARNECGDHFRSEDELGEHKTINEKKKVFKCSDDRLSLTDIVEPPQHQVKHSRSKPFQSSVYKRLHNPKLPFQVHQRHHTFQCPECPLCFISKSSLQTHQKTHTSRQPMAAPEVIADPSKDSISSHHLENFTEHLTQTSSECDNQSIDTKQKKDHPYKIVKLLPCPLCGKCFYSYYKLTRHYSIHTQEKPSKQSLANGSNSLLP